jgi:hypothetical protein
MPPSLHKSVITDYLRRGQMVNKLPECGICEQPVEPEEDWEMIGMGLIAHASCIDGLHEFAIGGPSSQPSKIPVCPQARDTEVRLFG